PAPRVEAATAPAVEHAVTDQRLERRHLEAPPADPGRDDHRTTGDLGAIRERHDQPLAVPAQRRRRLRQDDLGVEEPRLLDRAVGEVVAPDAAREAEVVRMRELLAAWP